MNETIEQLKPLMTEVASKIGQTAEWGWGVVVKQQIAYGIVAVFLALIGLITLILTYKVYYKWLKKNEKKIIENDYGNPFYGFLVGLVMLGIGMFISGTVNAILRLYNPEFYAIQFFINLVSK